MGFSDKQVHALRRSLNTQNIRTRRVEGRALSYIEGWHAIAEANRIFGFDRWDRETVESRCVLSRENRGSLHTVYVAKVRITVRADDLTVIREGYGTGESLGGGTIGEAHERALKMAETDATKRALATFGKPFGLGLYLSPRRIPEPRADNPNAGPPIPDHARRRTFQRLGSNGRYMVPPRTQGTFDPDVSRGIAGRDQPATTGATENTAGTGLLNDGDADKHPTTEHKPAPGNARATESPPLQANPDDNASSKGRLLIERTKRRREPAHLKFVASQPCLICGRTPSDAHHLKFAQPRALGRKVSDEFTVPLCRVHHRQLHHSGNEVQWWQAAAGDVDPLEIAKGLWEQSRPTARQVGEEEPVL